MADLNEPKKETVRISLPPQSTPPSPLAGEKEPARIILPNRPPARPAASDPATADLRPPASAPVRPPSPGVAPKPMPSSSGAPSPQSPTLPLARPPASLPSAGLKLPLTSAPPNPFPTINSPVENRGAAPAGLRKETARTADSPMKATVKLGSLQPAGVTSGPVLRTGPTAVANPPPQGLVESIPAQLCWALLAVSALTLIIQLWTYFS
jgi:hypothetical protein